MCGIAGYLGASQQDSVLTDMVSALVPRGPDGEGFYRDGNVQMGMRRLSVIDVAGGAQPVFNDDRSLAIVFNGEIYNYRELRDELSAKGHAFRTGSDTEVIVRLYQEYGQDCVLHLRGMFTFCIHDKKRNLSFIARDRLGVKPLYYRHAANGDFIFASEIKSLLRHPSVPREPDSAGINAYLAFRYSPGAGSMFAGIRKLPAGYRMTWQNGDVSMESYWKWEDHTQPADGLKTDEDYRRRFAELFEESVRLRMISDVPLGAFLSGGVDSTAIVAAMAKLGDRPVETFSVGFGWEGDELAEARETARKLGCNHHEIICREEDMALLPSIVHALDEPVGDPIVLPMYVVSRLARQHVTVSLSGEGADEMLCGYFMHKTLLRGRSIPKFLLPLLSAGVSVAPATVLDLAFDYPGKMGARSKQKLIDFLHCLRGGNLAEQYEFLISLFDERDGVAPPVSPAVSGVWKSEMAEMIALQQHHWLQDDILTKLDKMTMANSLEGRVPFMDHKLAEFMLSMPDHLKKSGGRNKAVLRDYLNGQLPGAGDRRKKAFYMPLEKYMATPQFRRIADECLSAQSVKKRGLLRPEMVQNIKNRLDSGDFVYAKQFFSLLSLELWFRIYIDREAGWV